MIWTYHRQQLPTLKRNGEKFAIVVENGFHPLTPAKARLLLDTLNAGSRWTENAPPKPDEPRGTKRQG